MRRAACYKIIFSIFAWLIWGAAEAWALERGKPLSHYARQVWQNNDGLPAGSINSIAQTADGYLWLATEAGLVRFKLFDAAAAVELAHTSIGKLYVSRDGTLWLGARRGRLISYREGKFTAYTLTDEPLEDHIRAIVEDRAGNLWVGLPGGGLVKFKAGQTVAITTKDGLGALALAPLLTSASHAQEAAAMSNPLAPKKPHFPGKAKRVIHLFMNGGPSQLDSFDPKPLLTKYDGKMLPFTFKTERKTGAGFPSPFKFQKHGQSGIDVSELFPHIAQCVDDICLLRSMQTDLPNHGPSFKLMNCGDARQPRPSLGAWTTYGLGSENQNLPGFVAMCPDGYPSEGTQNWRSGFLPGAYQGTYIDTQETSAERLIEFIKNRSNSQPEQRAQLDLLARLNRQHQQRRQDDAQLEARMQSFELAYRMQMEATDAFDISKEPAHIRRMYGETVHGRQLLMARRLLERGVRFIQVFHGEGQPWDSHDHLPRDYRKLALASDQPVAALLKDLKQRGMLDDTLVIWGGEFGRTPTVELNNAGKVSATAGRDHNPYGFTMWRAGGGAKRGYIHGATDEFGFQAVEKPMHVHDLHATILHLLGFDHERFTYRYAGRDFRLTDVHGRVIKDVLA